LTCLSCRGSASWGFTATRREASCFSTESRAARMTRSPARLFSQQKRSSCAASLTSAGRVAGSFGDKCLARLSLWTLFPCLGFGVPRPFHALIRSTERSRPLPPYSPSARPLTTHTRRVAARKTAAAKADPCWPGGSVGASAT
jgi:hypothetical protein